MRKLLCMASILLFPVLALALEAPANFQAALTDETTITTTWEPVDGATKYSVEIVAEYDTDGDGEADLSEDFDFSTADRTEGLPGDPNLSIPFDSLVLDVDGDGDLDTPVAAMARVKALNPGKGNGRQNNPFSAVANFYPAE